MGTILIEKLLRSCPKLKTIYILARQKKGKPIKDRFKEITNSQVRYFNINKNEKVSFFKDLFFYIYNYNFLQYLNNKMKNHFNTL